MLLLPLVVKDYICWHNLNSKVLAYLHLIFKAIVLSKILYALPVYYGYLTEGQKGMLRVLDRANSRGFTPYYYDLDLLAENAQYKLFRHSCQEAHCLSHVYPENLGHQVLYS